MSMLDDMTSGLMEKVMDQGIAKMPKCDICGGNLMSGSLTVPDDTGTPIAACLKCVFGAVQYFLKERRKRMNEPGG